MDRPHPPTCACGWKMKRASRKISVERVHRYGWKCQCGRRCTTSDSVSIPDYEKALARAEKVEGEVRLLAKRTCKRMTVDATGHTSCALRERLEAAERGQAAWQKRSQHYERYAGRVRAMTTQSDDERARYEVDLLERAEKVEKELDEALAKIAEFIDGENHGEKDPPERIESASPGDRNGDE